jgi:hypothetical protein
MGTLVDAYCCCRSSRPSRFWSRGELSDLLEVGERRLLGPPRNMKCLPVVLTRDARLDETISGSRRRRRVPANAYDAGVASGGRVVVRRSPRV